MSKGSVQRQGGGGAHDNDFMCAPERASPTETGLQNRVRAC